MFRTKITTLISGLVIASVAVTLGPSTVNAQSPAANSVPDGIVSGLPQIFIPEDAAAQMSDLDVPVGTQVDATGVSTALDEYWTPERMANAIPMDTPTIDISTQPATAAPQPRRSALDGLAETAASNPVNLLGQVADVEPSPAPLSITSVARANGKIFFTDPDTGLNGSCSGTAVNSPSKNLVATAAHCVHGGQGKSFYQNWVFVPGYLQGIGLDQFQAKKFYILDGWETSANTSTANAALADMDIAFVATNNLPVSGKRLVDRVGGQGLRTSGPLAFSATIFGYPSNLDGGAVQKRCSVNTTESTIEGYTLATGDCPWGPGASGGPWLADMNATSGYGYIRTVTSVSAHSDDDPTHKYIIGASLDSRALSLYQTANSGL